MSSSSHLKNSKLLLHMKTFKGNISFYWMHKTAEQILFEYENGTNIWNEIYSAPGKLT